MSEHRFAPGDLALTLVEGVDWPAMAEVVLCHFIPKGDRCRDITGYEFTADSDLWIVRREGDPTGDRFPPHHLMPLRGYGYVPLTKANEVKA